MATHTRPTQRDRIAALLSDGHWHSTAELYERTGITRVPARIYELKQRGYAIEDKRAPGPGNATWAYYRLTQGRLL